MADAITEARQARDDFHRESCGASSLREFHRLANLGHSEDVLLYGLCDTGLIYGPPNRPIERLTDEFRL